jgi:hypothetical protein
MIDQVKMNSNTEKYLGIKKGSSLLTNLRENEKTFWHILNKDVEMAQFYNMNQQQKTNINSTQSRTTNHFSSRLPSLS